MIQKELLAINSNKKWLFIFVVFFLIGSCIGSRNGPLDDINPYEDMSKKVEVYYDATSPKLAGNKSDSPKVYIDFSNGMIYAYTSNKQNAAMMESIAQRLTGFKWFGLANGNIEALNIPNTQVFNKVTAPGSYATQIMAPIGGAVKEITSSACDALLVTDFEEYTEDRKEQFENFAKGYFIDWLSKGNSIDFFITDYKEKAVDGRLVDKHLYFIVFNYGREKKLLNDINFALSDRNYKYNTFSLSTNFYALSNNYDGDKKGGNFYDAAGKNAEAKNVLAMNENAYVNGLKQGKAFEFYNFELPWDHVYNNTVNTPGFTDFFRKLYIDASKDDVFQLKQLDVKVYDVTDDYVFFTKAQEVTRHKPKLQKDANGNFVLAPEVNDAISLACYDTQGKILSDWVYKPRDKTPVNEVFTLNTTLFNNGIKENKNQIEIGIKYHPNFNVSRFADFNGLLRVDIVIAECVPNFSKLDLFKWNSITDANRQNESLSESIRNTLGDNSVNPTGKVIYSYFIRTLPDK